MAKQKKIKPIEFYNKMFPYATPAEVVALYNLTTKEKVQTFVEKLSDAAVFKFLDSKMKKTLFRVIERARKDESYTPPELVALINKVIGDIDFDAASCAKANEIIKADSFSTDGLNEDWPIGGTVFLNAPGSLKGKFYQKFLKNIDNYRAGCILEYNWDHSTSCLQAAIKRATFIVFLNERYRFSDKEVGRCQALLFFHKDFDFELNEEIKQHLSQFGIIMETINCASRNET